MVYDENKKGEIVDVRYLREDLITRYKLVCENDFDVGSSTWMNLGIAKKFVEVGLESLTEREALQEVKELLEKFRNGLRDASKIDRDFLIGRIDSLSDPEGRRPEETVIKEHLVRTGEGDPVIQERLET